MSRRKKHGVILILLFLTAFAYADEQTWVFTSIPDFVNTDLGTLVGYPGYPDGYNDSTTAGFEATLAFYLDALAAENSELVLVAGDLVEGEWHRDSTGRYIFGYYGTHAERQTSLVNAADLYYSQWVDRFTSRGLTPYACVGDHELGDNNWGAGSNRARLVPDFKDAFAKYFTKDSNGVHKFSSRPVGTPYEDTSYAFQHKNVLFITIDVFRQDDPYTKLDNRTGSVVATVDGNHLTWLDNVLTAADSDPNIDHVIVQAHSPVLTPVRVRGSSELYLRDYDGTTDGSNADWGANTDFWQTLAAHDVDFFFAGEVHHNTLSISDGVIQIVHDGIPYSSGNYLLCKVTGKKIEFEIKHVDIGQGTEKFWQTVASNKTETVVDPCSLIEGWQTVATATYDKSTGVKKLTNLTGELIPYAPGVDDGSVEWSAKFETTGPYGKNFDFEDPPNWGTTGELSQDVIDWEEIGQKSLIDWEDGSWAPVGMTNIARVKAADSGRIWQNMAHAWSLNDVYRLSFDAYEVGWRSSDSETGDKIYFSINESDGTVLSSVGNINVDGTLSGDSAGSVTYGATPHNFEYLIYASDWQSNPDASEGKQLQILFGADGGVVWLDNVSFCMLPDLDCSGDVDLVDFAKMAYGWMSSDVLLDIAPPVGDGLVDANDLEILMNNWLR